MQIRTDSQVTHTHAYTQIHFFFIEFSERISFVDRQDNKKIVYALRLVFHFTMPVVCLLSCVSRARKSKQKLNFHFASVFFLWAWFDLNNKQINKFQERQKKTTFYRHPSLMFIIKKKIEQSIEFVLVFLLLVKLLLKHQIQFMDAFLQKSMRNPEIRPLRVKHRRRI